MNYDFLNKQPEKLINIRFNKNSILLNYRIIKIKQPTLTYVALSTNMDIVYENNIDIKIFVEYITNGTYSLFKEDKKNLLREYKLKRILEDEN